jgi:ribosomal protein S18 acetylase RimI-like enzyme
LFDVTIKECTDSDSITELFEEHRNAPFTYLSDIHLFRLFSRLKSFRAFVAEVDGRVVGCVYGLKYTYGYGWIGGLFVHRSFRRMGVGRRLLERVLQFLGPEHAYLFVMPENVAAKKLVENVGFSAVYRRLNYEVGAPFEEFRDERGEISYDVEWDDFTTALGFKERSGVVNMGYYPIKVTKSIFEDLKKERKILRCGNVFAVTENSYNVKINGDTFTFNDHILKELSLQPEEKIVEVNPFYGKALVRDLIELINHLAAHGKVAIWTYQEDTVARSLPLEGTLATSIMEFPPRRL